ncbi:O-antigen ligase family protein, partial [Clostridium perfringens]
INSIICIIPVLNIFPESGTLNRCISIYCIIAIIFNIIIQKKDFVFNNVNKRALLEIIIFYLILLLSLAIASDKNIAKTIFLQQIQYVLIGLYLIFSNKDYKNEITIKTILFSSTLILIPCIVQIISENSDLGLFNIYNSNTFSGRISGPFSDSLHLTQYLGVILAIFLGYSYKYKTNKIISIVIILLLISLIYAQSKIGIISFLVIFAIFILFKYRKNYIAILLIILIGILILLVIFSGNLNYILQLDIFNRFNELQESSSTRIMFWKSGISMFLDNLYGIGLGNYRVNVFQYMPLDLITFRFSGGIVDFTKKTSTHAESIYFTFLAEGGLQLVIMYIYLLTYNIKQQIKIIFTEKNNYISLGLLLAWIVIMLDGITLNNFFIKPVQTQFWIIYALSTNIIFNHKVIKYNNIK